MYLSKNIMNNKSFINNYYVIIITYLFLYEKNKERNIKKKNRNE